MIFNSDAIIIFGGSLKNGFQGWRTTYFNEKDKFGSLGDRLRVLAGNFLYKNFVKYNPNLKILTSGGKGQLKIKNNGAPCVSEVLKKELIDLGVKSNKIFTEKFSSSTYQQLKELNKIILKKKFKKIILISNEYHLPRIRAMMNYGKKLKNLKRMLSEKKIVLSSAEKILLIYNPKWKKIITKAYKSKLMKKRIKLEKKGVMDIKNGLYKLI